MTDDQFEKFMTAMTQRQTDHDLLVEINTVVRLNHESYEKEKVDTAEKIGVAKKAADAAHRRIDYIFTGVMVSVGGLVLSVIVFFITNKGGNP